MGEPRAQLGRALIARADDVAAAVLATVEPRAASLMGPEVAEAIAETDRLATRLMGRWLDSGEMATADERRQLAALGSLVDALALPDLVKAYLAWRDVMFVVLAEEAARLGCPPALVAEVRDAVSRNCDGTLVRMGRHFDDERRRLQAELVDERAKLAHQALHDSLTGLPNRTLLFDRLEQALRAASRYGASLAVLFVDLDGFKAVNDRFGHEAGDQLLIEVAARLTDAVRPSDTVARFGGDEFIVLCDRLDSDRPPAAVAERVLQAICRPYALPGGELAISASVGVATAGGGDAEGPGELLLRADFAMYAAKQRGPGCHHVAA